MDGGSPPERWAIAVATRTPLRFFDFRPRRVVAPFVPSAESQRAANLVYAPAQARSRARGSPLNGAASLAGWGRRSTAAAPALAIGGASAQS